MKFQAKRNGEDDGEDLKQVPVPLDRTSALKMISTGLDALTDPKHFEAGPDGIVRGKSYSRK